MKTTCCYGEMKAPCQLSTVHTSLVSLSVIKPVLLPANSFPTCMVPVQREIKRFLLPVCAFQHGPAGSQIIFICLCFDHGCSSVVYSCVHICLSRTIMGKYNRHCAIFITRCWSDFELYIKHFARYSYS